MRDLVKGNLGGSYRLEHALRAVVLRRQDLRGDALPGGIVPTEEIGESAPDIDADSPHGSLLPRGRPPRSAMPRLRVRTRTTIPLSTCMRRLRTGDDGARGRRGPQSLARGSAR